MSDNARLSNKDLLRQLEAVKLINHVVEPCRVGPGEAWYDTSGTDAR